MKKTGRPGQTRPLAKEKEMEEHIGQRRRRTQENEKEENIWRRVIFGQWSKRGTGKEQKEENIWSVEQNMNGDGKYLEKNNTYLDSVGEK